MFTSDYIFWKCLSQRKSVPKLAPSVRNVQNLQSYVFQENVSFHPSVQINKLEQNCLNPMLFKKNCLIPIQKCYREMFM